MDIDPATLVGLLLSGASTASSTVVKEATQDAYRACKSKIADMLGVGATDALSKLEAKPDDAMAATDFEVAAAALTDADKNVLQPLLAGLTAALAADEQARTIAHQKGLIRLDFDAGGNVTVARVVGASIIDVKARAARDITFPDIEIDSGDSSGN